MKFIVADRSEAERGLLVREPYVVISIRDPGRPKARIPHPGHCRGVLFLAFHDAEPSCGFLLPKGVKAMTPEHAEAIRRFFQDHRPYIRAVVIHCEQGMSRSPAVARALALATGEDASYFDKHYQPNRHVEKLMVDALEATNTMAQGDVALVDVLRPGLQVVFCGTAVGKRSAAEKSYYAGPNNAFWETLHQTGLTPRQLLPREFPLLPTYGIGLTDLVKFQYGNDCDLTTENFGVDALRAKLVRNPPKILAFNGKKAAAVYFDCKTSDLTYGLNDESLGMTAIHVLPSTSGGARAYWDLSHWQAMATNLKTR